MRLKARNNFGATRIFAGKHSTISDDVWRDLFEHNAHVLAASAECRDSAVGYAFHESAALRNVAAFEQLHGDVGHLFSSESTTAELAGELVFRAQQQFDDPLLTLGVEPGIRHRAADGIL